MSKSLTVQPRPRNSCEVLQKARELLSDPKKWTKQSFAKDQYGNPACPSDEKAKCWCLMGAVMAASSHSASLQEEAFSKLYSAIKDATSVNPSIAAFNDDPRTTHEDVIAVLNNAIRL